LISNKKLIELYSAMVMCRMIAERAGLLKGEGKLRAALDAGVGREAAIAGIAVDLTREDTLSATPQLFVSEFLKGTTLNGIFSGLANGQAHAAITSANGSAPSESSLDGACIAAKANKIAKNGKISVAFCETERVHAGHWRRSLTMASKQGLPLVFVRQLAWREGAGEKPVRKKVTEDLPEALQFGVPTIQVDGNDVVAVYRVASESTARARRGQGPTVIDCISVSADHGVASQNGSLRGASDPIVVMETHLIGKGLFKPNLKKTIESGFGLELDKATRLFVN
jgi:acetoin:2,6-dichlorophenolindophenol oxidoreductase subunit alpha